MARETFKAQGPMEKGCKCEHLMLKFLDFDYVNVRKI